MAEIKALYEYKTNQDDIKTLAFHIKWVENRETERMENAMKKDIEGQDNEKPFGLKKRKIPFFD